MNLTSQIENLKQELREFIELSKTITSGEWDWTDANRSGEPQITSNGNALVCTVHHECVKPIPELNANATFIARSRNISPAMAECLLVTIDTALDCESWDADLRKMYLRPDAERVLQQILTIWEASK